MRNKSTPYIYAIIILGSGFGLISSFVYYFLPLPQIHEVVKLKQKGASIVSVDVSAIFSRNIFNIEGTFPNETENEGQIGRCTGAPTKSPLPYDVLGIIYGGSGAGSVAVLKNRDTQEILIIKQNTKLPQKGYVSDISADRVWFISTGCPEYIELPKPKLPASRTRRGAEHNMSDGAYSEPGFERIGTNTNVTRQWVDDILTNKLTSVLGEALATPHVVNGRIDGFTVSQIDPGSVYDKLGLKNGDVVMSINNNSLNDAGQAIQTLNALRNERNIDLEVMRNGQNVSFRVNVQP